MKEEDGGLACDELLITALLALSSARVCLEETKRKVSRDVFLLCNCFHETCHPGLPPDSAIPLVWFEEAADYSDENCDALRLFVAAEYCTVCHGQIALAYLKIIIQRSDRAQTPS